jgi:hypothetical protein
MRLRVDDVVGIGRAVGGCLAVVTESAIASGDGRGDTVFQPKAHVLPGQQLRWFWGSADCVTGVASWGMAEWFSIEVLEGASSARAWREAFGDRLLSFAYGTGMSNWHWEELDWGVVLEVELPDEFAFERFRDLPGVRAALDAVPDPVGGLLVHRGRGGSAGARVPRRPRPFAGAGAVALPEPFEPEEWTLVPISVTAVMI